MVQWAQSWLTRAHHQQSIKSHLEFHQVGFHRGGVHRSSVMPGGLKT